MRVGIDLRPLQRELSGGVVQYVDDLCPALFDAASDASFVVYHAASGYRLAGPRPRHVRQVELPDGSDPSRLDVSLARDRVDVLFRPFPYDDTLAFPARRRFTLLPDLQHADHPELFSCAELEARRRAFGAAVAGGGAIGLLARHSEDRLRAHFPTVGAKVVRLPPGPPTLAATLATPLTADEHGALPDAPFFLYPANLWGHKNHRLVARAFARFLASTSERYALVLTGSTVGNADLLEEWAELPIVHLGFVSRRLLAELYRRCTALVYFSLYEGFGLPVLEAFQLGAPVLCSNTTSLIDVGADASMRCDPTDVQAMAQLMQRIACSGNLRAALVARGRARLEEYSWTRPAENLLGALRELHRAPPAHDDLLGAIRVLGDKVMARESERREAAAALAGRDREIGELRSALKERTAWAEQNLASAEERLEVIHALQNELASRDREIDTLRAALRERAAWGDEALRTAEERLEVIRAQEASICELRRALDEWTARGVAMAEEYRRVSAAAQERLDLIERLHGMVAGSDRPDSAEQSTRPEPSNAARDGTPVARDAPDR